MFVSLRTLRRHWKLSVISAFSLSIAMALGVVSLSFSNTILIVPPAAPEPDRLVMMNTHTAENAFDHFSYLDYEYYRDNNHVFTGVAAAPNNIGLLDDFNFEGHEVKVVTRPVSTNYFDVMAIHPHLGRFFGRGDESAKESLAVMTWSCWKRIGSDPHIVGKVLARHTIIGVAPQSFTGAFFGLNGDLFTTFQDFDGDRTWMKQRASRRLVLTARLKPGVSRRQAQAEVTMLARQLASAYPKEDKDRTAIVSRATLLPPDTIPDAELMASILMALVLLVLLIACANVANLLLAVAVGRRQEAAIKLALGAPRGWLIREFLQESTVLCAAGTLLGLLISLLAIAKYSEFTISFPMLGSFSAALDLRLDATVVSFILLLFVIASLATGLAPALYASSPGIAQILSAEMVAGGKRKGLRRNALVVVQVATCTLVLVGMGLCERSLYNLRHVDFGFSHQNLLADTIYLEGEGYSGERSKAFHNTLRQTISALPGVESVALSQDLPLMGVGQSPVQPPDSVKTVNIHRTVVDGDFFGTFGIPILQGRTFNANDRENSAPVAIINHKMAETFWPGKDPVGRTIMAGDPARKVTVVGVAADSKYLDVDEPLQPFIYYALTQNYGGAVIVTARTKADPRAWVEPFAQALRGLGLKIMIQPATFQGWLNVNLLAQRIIAGCIGILSGLGLLLAVIGLFGAISYSVSERKKELGIRVALGARPVQLLKMVLRQTSFVAGSGVILGILIGVGGTAIFRSQLYGISAIELSVLIPVGAAMLVVSLAVAYFSAKPWLKISPMEAIRHT